MIKSTNNKGYLKKGEKIMTTAMVSNDIPIRVVEERRATNVVVFPNSQIQLFWPYDGSYQGNDGDIVFRLDGKEFVTNVNWLERIISSGEYFEQDRQKVLNLIAFLNLRQELIVKAWMNSGCEYWVHSNNQAEIRIIFSNFPKSNKISYIFERR